MANPSYRFGNYDFEDNAERLGWEYNITAPTYPLGRDDGSKHGGATVTSKTIRLDGYIASTDYASWRDVKDTLMAAMFPTPRIQKLALSDDREYWAEVVSFSIPDWIGLPEMPFSITFLCHDPFEYQNVVQNTFWTDASTGVYTGYTDTRCYSSFVFSNGGMTVRPKIIFGWQNISQPIILQTRWANLLANSDFGIDTNVDGLADSWVKSGNGNTMLDPAFSVFGDVSQRITNSVVQTTDISQLVPTGAGLQGATITSSVYVRRTTGTSGVVRQRIEQYSAAGTLISSHNGAQFTSAVTFARDSLTVAINSNCYYIKYILSNGGDCEACFDGAMIEITDQTSTWNNGIVRSMTLTDSVTVNDIIVVDCDARTVTQNNVNSLNYMTGEFFTFEHGDNLLILSHAGNGFSAGWFQGLFIPRYL
jgi:hypothetical protein